MRLYFIALALLLSSCAFQVFDINATNTKPDKGNYTFENDSIQIRYDFWAEHGLVYLTILNKLKKPIYIDWKNSFFILNSYRFVYWNDEIISSTQGKSARSMSYYYNSHYQGYWYNSVTNSIKPERITSIPPQSVYSRANFIIAKDPFILKKENEVKFTQEDSPIKFRNYLAISTTEASPSLVYIDNDFYVSQIRMLKRKQFKSLDNKPLSFYIEIESEK